MKLRTPHSIVLFMLAAMTCVRAAEALPRFVNVFAPFTTEVAALSPDGRRLAYTLRNGEDISIIALEVDAPTRATTSVLAATDRRTVGYMESETRQRKASVFWMKWADPERVVFQSNVRFLTTQGDLFGAVYGFNFNGGDARMLYSARESNGPIVVADLVGGPKPGVLVRARGDLAFVDAKSGGARILSRAENDATRRELQARTTAERTRYARHHAELKRCFPGYEVTLFQHHGTSERVLALVEGATEPGFFAVYDPVTMKVWDFARRMPSVEELGSHRIEDFDVAGDDGERFTGCLVLPREKRISRAPVVLWLPERLGDRAPRQYEPEIRALAEMGFAVAVIDGANVGSRRKPVFDDTGRTPGPHVWAGFERTSDLYVMSRGVDQQKEFARQIRALDVLARQYAISRKAVALFGKGENARRALEATASMPGAFRCVVAIDPKDGNLSPRGPYVFETLDQALARLQTSPCEAALLMTPRPEMSLASGWGIDPIDSLPLEYLATNYAGRMFESLGVQVTFSRLEPGFVAKEPTLRAKVFRDVERFLTTYLYRFSVQIGEVTEVE